MSERDRIEAAKHNGKKAYWNGVPLDQNPMRAPDSRMAWMNAWLREQHEHQNRERLFKKYVMQKGATVAEPTNYDKMTSEDFDRHLLMVMNRMTMEQVLAIPGVYEVLSEELNNEVLDSWAKGGDHG